MPLVFDLLPFARQLDFKYVNGEQRLFDLTRKTYLKVSPEEIVRQSLILKLVNDFSFPISRMQSEYEIYNNQLVKRIDLLIYNRKGMPLMIIETKAPSIKLNQKAIDQVVFYNNVIFAPWLMVANGSEALLASIDFETGKTTEFFEFPNNLNKL
jgi:predicted type IV restriction endonuclease